MLGQKVVLCDGRIIVSHFKVILPGPGFYFIIYATVDHHGFAQ